MTHRFPIKEIALQSALSTATVDRVLNARSGVSPQARARVAAAIRELEGQEAQLSARGRRLFFDIVVEAPDRFTREIRRATQAVLPSIGPAVIRPRFTFQQKMSEGACCDALERIARRGSHGVCLKARDLPGIRAAVARLQARRIPVVTIFTDLPGSGRLAYAGPDNRRAGRMAAYLMDRFLTGRSGTILTTRSDARFHGETERLEGFRTLLSDCRPDLGLLDVGDGAGLTLETTEIVARAVAGVAHIAGVYSMGGANAAILRTLAGIGQVPDAFIAHDLDKDNISLLRSGALTVVLQHDIERDIREAFVALLAAQGVLPRPVQQDPSQMTVITPLNLG